MKRLFLIALLIGTGIGAVYVAQQGILPGFATDRGTLKTQSIRFVECLKFKDFKAASLFHSPEDLKANPDIPKLLEDFFLIPPESLDIQDIRLDFVELDSTGDRAKVKLTTTIYILNKKETQKPEVMLYWRRAGPRWYLDLRSTLERGHNH